MGIVWLIIPIMEMAYWLIIPFIVGLILSMSVLAKSGSLQIPKFLILLTFVIIFAVVQFNHPKDWPSLFFYCHLICTIVFYLFYLKLVKNLATKTFEKGEQKDDTMKNQ